MKTGPADGSEGTGRGTGGPVPSPRRKRGAAYLLLTIMVLAFGAGGYLLAPALGGSREKTFTVHAYQYGYRPEIIRVNQGDLVRLRFVSEDVVHGFYLEGHDLDVVMVPMRRAVERRWPSRPGVRRSVEEVSFTADRTGKFRYRCSQSCGYLHPFMLGEFIVAPNRLLWTGLALAAGILIAGGIAVTFTGRAA